MSPAAVTRRHRPTALLVEDLAPRGRLEVDHVNGVIKRVKVLGRHSKNSHNIKGATRTEYTLDAMARAVPIFEGLQGFLDHPPRSNLGDVRSVRDLVCVYHNPTHDEEGVYADMHVDPNDPAGKKLLWVAENEPAALKLSQNAVGAYEVRDGVAYITEIKEVRSVDVVTRAGTTTSLAESEQSMTLKKITAAALAEMGMECSEDADPGEGDHEDHLFNAFKALKASDPEKANKILKMLTADVEEDDEDEDEEEGKGGGTPPGEGTETPPDDKKKAAAMKESLELKTRRCERLCKLAKVTPSKPLLEALAELSEDKAIALLEGWQEAKPARGTPPRSDPPKKGAAVSLSDPRQFARAVKHGG